MAALLLSADGAALGKSLFGPGGEIIGRIVGAVACDAIDQALFGSRRERTVEERRLSDLTLMALTDGAPIPRRLRTGAAGRAADLGDESAGSRQYVE